MEITFLGTNGWFDTHTGSTTCVLAETENAYIIFDAGGGLYKTFDIIKKYATHNNIYISSFDYKALENVREIDSNIKLAWLIKEKINNENINKLLKINGTQICPKADNVTKDDIELALKNGLRVRLWGVSNEKIMQEVYKFDIDGMTVNFPDKLQHLIENENNCKACTHNYYSL